MILDRARGAYAAEIRIVERKLEKAEEGSEEWRALHQRGDELKSRVGQIVAALKLLKGK